MRAHCMAKTPLGRLDAATALTTRPICSDEDFTIPKGSGGQVDFEGELVAVLGMRARNIPEERALRSVAGYALGNEISERSWQRSDRTPW